MIWKIIPLWLWLASGGLFWVGSLAYLPRANKKAFWTIWTPIVILIGPLMLMLAFVPRTVYMPFAVALRQKLDSKG
jgi:hypothetical protein